jgi:hypothetical protein
VRDAEDIARHGQSLGLTDSEIADVMRQWSQRSGVTADAVKQEMTAARATRPAGEPTAVPASETPWVPPKSWNAPVNHGRWLGARGNSDWIDTRPEVIRVVGRNPVTGEANPIPFRNGVIDFSRWSQGELIVPGLTGVHRQDMPLIRLAIADRYNLLPGASRTARHDAALEWLSDAADGFGGAGLRLHHAGGNRIQLIPRDLHAVQHTDLHDYSVPE